MPRCRGAELQSDQKVNKGLGPYPVGNGLSKRKQLSTPKSARRKPSRNELAAANKEDKNTTSLSYSGKDFYALQPRFFLTRKRIQVCHHDAMIFPIPKSFRALQYTSHFGASESRFFFYYHSIVSDSQNPRTTHRPFSSLALYFPCGRFGWWCPDDSST